MKNWFKTNTDSSPKDKKWWKPNISWLKLDKRKDVVNELKQHTKPDGIHVMNVFVDKPFVEILPGKEKNRFRWKSGQIFTLYHDWYFHKIEEVVFDCNSGGVPHQHCMDIMIARNKSKES